MPSYRLRKRLNDGNSSGASSSSSSINNNTALKNNTSSFKRKKLSAQSNDAVNDKIQREYRKDTSENKRQRDSTESTETNDDHTPFEESLATIILEVDYYTLCDLAYEKLSWKVGNGQCHVQRVQRSLIQYYDSEGSGVDTLKADIAAINHNYFKA